MAPLEASLTLADTAPPSQPYYCPSQIVYFCAYCGDPIPEDDFSGDCYCTPPRCAECVKKRCLCDDRLDMLEASRGNIGEA
jgi:hypothetical protein